jgi:hypothetical protein
MHTENEEFQDFGVLQILLEMANWYTSSLSIGQYTRRFFRDKTIQIQHFLWDGIGPFECHEEDVAAILGVISSRRTHSQTIHDLQKAVSSATIHAASAWTVCVHYKPGIFADVSNSHPPLPVGLMFGFLGLTTLHFDQQKLLPSLPAARGRLELQFQPTAVVFRNIF